LNRAEPQRVQLRRTKGWRKPEGAIIVTRPSRWGNPYKIGDPDPVHASPMSRDRVVGWFEAMFEIDERIPSADIGELRGHDLACWCPLDQPCHADVLLEIANS
jgi:hypothetical protein